MKQDYVIVKQLPDAGVGTIIKWDEERQAYIYPKSVPVSDALEGSEWVENALSKEQVQDNKEFFAPMDKAYMAGVDPLYGNRSKYNGPLGPPSNQAEALKDANSEEKRQRNIASRWEEIARKNQEKEKHYRESLKEAHALIGRLIHYIEGRVDKVNISKYFDKPNW